MRILLVNHTFLPDDAGGAELHTFWMARELASRGHAVEVVCGRETPEIHFLTELHEMHEGVSVTRLKLPVKFGATAWSVREDVMEWARLKLGARRVDVVHVGLFWNLSSIAHAACELGIPFVLDVHLYSLFCARHFLLQPGGVVCDGQAKPAKCRECMVGDWSFGQRLKGFVLGGLPRGLRDLLRRLLGGGKDGVPILHALDSVQETRDEGRWLMRHAAAILATTEFVAEVHRRNGAPMDRVISCPHGIPAMISSAPEVSPRASGPIRFGMVSRLTPEKGLDTLIEAVRRIPLDIHFEVHIFGDPNGPGVGDFGQRLRKMASGEVRIYFEGPIKNEQLECAYAGMDMLVVPSRWHEVQGLTVLEALARRTPVLVSNLGGLPEAVRPGVNGLVFRGGDPSDLARMMMKVVEDPSCLDPMRRGIQMITSISEAAGRLEGILERILEEGASRDAA